MLVMYTMSDVTVIRRVEFSQENGDEIHYELKGFIVSNVAIIKLEVDQTVLL